MDSDIRRLVESGELDEDLRRIFEKCDLVLTFFGGSEKAFKARWRHHPVRADLFSKVEVEVAVQGLDSPEPPELRVSLQKQVSLSQVRVSFKL